MKRRLLLALAAVIVALIFAVVTMWLFAHLASVTDTNHETGKSVVVGRR